MSTIHFRNIPGKTKLFYDYLEQSPRVAKFYNGHHRRPNDFTRLAEKVVMHDYHRDRLSQVLRKINEKYGLTPAVEANLELLKHDETVTVITGQQAGMFTGPLYTILKAITALKVASELGKKLKLPVVPLFWMESSDHDLAEVNHIYFPGPQNPQKYVYGSSENPEHLSVGSIAFGKDFETYSARIKEALPNNDFYEAITRLMDETYFPDETFSEAFGKMMSRLLGRWGLIIVDAENVELKRLAAPIIIRKLEERGQMNKLLLEQSRALEQEQYEKQILIRSELLNVFILKDNTRIPMTVLGEMLTNGEEKEILSDQELIQLATEYPERFSPKVAFRPIVQDFLFPTVAYIGGPSELTYFAQLKKIYEFFEIQMPIIWPRITATLIDAKIKRLMQKVGIDVKEIFREEEEVIQNILGKYSPLKPEGVFSEAGKRLDEVIDWLEGKLTQLDPSLSGQFKSSYSKMHYQVNSMKIRTFNQLKAQHQSVINNWKSLQVLVYPQKKLQDRVYNILYFLSRYGFWLMDYLTENLDINTDDHQILEIPAYSG